MIAGNNRTSGGNMFSRSAFLAIGLLSAQGAFARILDAVYAAASPSVVTIINAVARQLTPTGSGVVVSPGVVVTPCYATSGARTLVMWHDQVLPVASLRADPYHDLCQLRVKELGAPAAVLAPSTQLRVGQAVYAIGTGNGNQMAVQTVHVQSFAAPNPYSTGSFARYDTRWTLSNRGGGIFDSGGRLVGIAVTANQQGVSLPPEWLSKYGLLN